MVATVISPLIATQYNASEKETRATLIKSCTPACNFRNVSSYHKYHLKYISVANGKDSIAGASSYGGHGSYEATAISGNDYDVDRGSSAYARAHAGTLDGTGVSSNSLASY